MRSSLTLASVLALVTACGDGDKGIMRCQKPSAASTRAQGKFTLQFEDSQAHAPETGYIVTVATEGDGYVKLEACASPDDDYFYVTLVVKVLPDATIPVAFDNSDPATAHAGAYVGYCLGGDCSEREQRWYGYPLIDPPVSVAETSGTLAALAPGALKSQITLTDVTPGSTGHSTIVIETDLKWTPR